MFLSARRLVTVRRNNAYGASQDVHIVIVSLSLLFHEHFQYLSRICKQCETPWTLLKILVGMIWTLFSSHLKCSGDAPIPRFLSDHLTSYWRLGYGTSELLLTCVALLIAFIVDVLYASICQGAIYAPIGWLKCNLIYVELRWCEFVQVKSP